MDPFFAWVEDGWLSVWIRSSDSILAFPGIIVLHTLGMGFLAGINAVIDLRILGVASRIPLASLEKFFPVLWLSFAINVFSGVLLLVAYPTKALTNPVFYLKLLCIGVAVWLMQKIRGDVLRDPLANQMPSRRAKRLAIVSLALWLIGIAAGRLLAYTYTRLLVGDPVRF